MSRPLSASSPALDVVIARASPGLVLIVLSADGVCAVLLGDDEATLRADAARRFRAHRLVDGDPDAERRAAAVIAHIESPRSALGEALDIRGTAFQRTVWDALRAIRPGTTTTYSGIAAQVGRPAAARAVAQACAANAHAVLIPCHRVVRRDGGLSGYRWGTARKRALLEAER